MSFSPSGRCSGRRNSFRCGGGCRACGWLSVIFATPPIGAIVAAAGGGALLVLLGVATQRRKKKGGDGEEEDKDVADEEIADGTNDDPPTDSDAEGPGFVGFNNDAMHDVDLNDGEGTYTSSLATLDGNQTIGAATIDSQVTKKVSNVTPLHSGAMQAV